jgi:hypothetical protein
VVRDIQFTRFLPPVNGWVSALLPYEIKYMFDPVSLHNVSPEEYADENYPFMQRIDASGYHRQRYPEQAPPERVSKRWNSSCSSNDSGEGFFSRVLRCFA